MNSRKYLSKFAVFALSFCLSLGFALKSTDAISEDIDIFSVDLDQNVDNPNVLIILDNSANWSRQAQQWPSSDTQGQSEARAIASVISQLGENVNVGLMMYRTQSNNANNANGYVRYSIRPMTSANKTEFADILYGTVNPDGTPNTPSSDSIFSEINDPDEKRDSNNPHGNLMWEAYNYFTGDNSIATQFVDEFGNITYATAGQGTPGQIGSKSFADSLAYDSQYDNFRAPLTAEDTCTRTIIIFIGNNAQGSLTLDSAQNKAALAALGGDTDQLQFAEFVETRTPGTPTLLGSSNACYNSQSSCTAAEDDLCMLSEGLDPSLDADINDPNRTVCTCDASSEIACNLPRFDVSGVNYTRGSVKSDPAATPLGTADLNETTRCRNSQPNAPSCPSSSTTLDRNFSTLEETETVTSWSNCRYVDTTTSCGGGGKTDWKPVGDKTTDSIVYNLDASTPADAGSQCSADGNCDTTVCDSLYDECTCTSSGICTTGTFSYDVYGSSVSISLSPTGNFTDPPPGDGDRELMADEWARFMRGQGLPIPGGARAYVTTYTIDVFNAQQNPEFSGLFFNMARAGGGKYYQAKNESEIQAALEEIFTEAQAVNTAFSSASLPVNATNRAQNENQVFIGLFRPDRVKNPLWFGNLKRYQLIENGPKIELGDKDGNPAVNELTGFITECATSFWTTASGDYWTHVITDNPDAVSNCPTISAGTEHSDLPDGPFVEKGAAAEVLRKGNNDASASSIDADGNYGLYRNLESLSGGSLVAFSESLLADIDRDGDSDVDAVDATLKTSTAKFARGEDVLDDDGDAPGAAVPDRTLIEPRSTIHGDVVHSRPQPVNYGGSMGVVIFYGANDGTYRAVKAEDGTELWSFIAPEHFGKLDRLKNNSPKIRFPSDPLSFLPKDYFFDGTTGIYQTFDADNEADNVRIFATMRRGGRVVYAFNVTDPANPTYMWKHGCSAAIPDTASCDAGFEDMGQTWSQPNVAFIKGYPSVGSETPVIVIGGGYNPCEDVDSKTVTCTNNIGSGVYVIDALTGTLLQYFDFNARSVTADVSLIDINQDSFVDFGYAADTGGNIYRMDFVDNTNNFAPVTFGSWTSRRIAYTSGASRKFLFTPALIQASANIVYLAIGSGDREHPLYSSYPVQADSGAGINNRFYTFKDDITDNANLLNLDNTTPDVNGKNFMVDNTTFEDAGGNSIDSCDADGILPTDNESGWFFDLTEPGDDPGEQVVTSAVIAGGSVIFSTNQATTTSPTACTNSLGIARGYNVNLLTGAGTIGEDGLCGGDRSSEFVGGGLPPSPVISTVPINGVVHTVIIGAPQKDGSASSAIEAQKVVPPIAGVRTPVYWFKSIDVD